MKTSILISALLSSALLLAIPGPARADSAIGEMAGIVLHLNHHPSSDEKKELREILDSDHATQGERTLARALLNMNHKVEGADRDRLAELARNDSAPAAERELADILLNLRHKPSGDDKERLQRLR